MHTLIVTVGATLARPVAADHAADGDGRDLAEVVAPVAQHDGEGEEDLVPVAALHVIPNRSGREPVARPAQSWKIRFKE